MVVSWSLLWCRECVGVCCDLVGVCCSSWSWLLFVVVVSGVTPDGVAVAVLLFVVAVVVVVAFRGGGAGVRSHITARAYIRVQA